MPPDPTLPAYRVLEVGGQPDGLLFAHVVFWPTGLAAAAGRPPAADESFHSQIAEPTTVTKPVLHENGRWVKRLDGGWDQVWVEVDGDWRWRPIDPAVHELVTEAVVPPPPAEQLSAIIDRHIDHVLAHPEAHVPDLAAARAGGRGHAKDPAVRAMVGQRRAKGDR